MTKADWVREHVAPHLHWGVYLWIALLPIQLPVARALGVRLALSDVALATTLLAAVACWMAEPGRLRRPILPRTSLNRPLVAVVAVLAMGLLVAWARTSALSSYVLLNKGAGLLVLAAAFYTMIVLLNTPERLRAATRMLLWSVGSVNVASLVLFGVWIRWGLRTPVVVGRGRFAGLLIDPNAWGGLLVVAFLLQLGFLIERRVRTRWTSILGGANALLLLSGLAWTQSRTAWLAFAVGAAAFAWLVRRRLAWKHVVVGALAAVCAGALAWWLAGDLLVPLFQGALNWSTIGQRWELITGGLREFRTSPIWGIGLDVSRWLGGSHIIHTTYVWFLVEMGGLGLVALLALLIRVGRNWIAALKMTGWAWGLAVGGAAAFAAMLGLALGIEATYQRHLWFLFALAEGLRRSVRAEGSPAAPFSPRVLFVATVAGTLRAFLIPHMKMLRDRGWHVEAAARFRRSYEIQTLTEAGFSVHHIPLRRRVLSLVNLLALWRLWRLISGGGFDIVHVHTPVAAMIGRLAARLARPRSVILYTAHGFHFYRSAPWYSWLFFYPAERLAARWTDGLIVMNEEDFRLGRRLGFSPGKTLFRVHGVGVDIDRYAGKPADRFKVRKELGLGPDDVLVTCIAQFKRGKNHRLLLDAWQLIADEQPNACLLLVGDGARLPAVRRRILARRVPRVQLAGFRRDVPSVLQATDLFVLASRREGLPRCIMEAMAAARPVVAMEARGSRELVEQGVTGLLVGREDAEGLARALLTLIRDPGLRREMGQRGREKVEAYALDRVLDEMWPIYDRFRRLGAERSSGMRGKD